MKEKVIYFLPENEIEKSAVEQIKNMSCLPFIFKHIAVMPDCHYGKGSCVGTVIPSKNSIIPAAVGVDIGCGMMAIKTTLKANDLPENLNKIMDEIEDSIPLNKGAKNKIITGRMGKILSKLEKLDTCDFLGEEESLQLGTLGSGNHFIEISLDENDDVWVVLHSGSRRLGNNIANWYINSAKNIMKKYFIELPDPDLAYLVQETQEFKDYIKDLSFAQKYAYYNRLEMMERIYSILKDNFPEIGIKKHINCHHNFTQKEYHFNENIWVTRKGAIQLRKGQEGIIPGSMGTSTFIVEGIGSKISFDSAPHGAGRRLSRNKAKDKYTEDDLKNAMSNIVYRHRHEIIDEIPMAYKDINKVIEYSKNLLIVRHELKQILNIKGN